MSGPTTEERCARCGRVVSILDPTFSDGDSIDGSWVCGGCVTGEEEQALAEDAMALVDELTVRADGEYGPPDKD